MLIRFGRQSNDYQFRVFTVNHTPEISPHTRLLDQLCNIMLSQTSRQPMDQRSVALVQIQRLSQRIVLMKTSREMSGRSSVPLNVVVVEFQQRISTLKESLSAKLILDRKLSKFHFFVSLVDAEPTANKK